MDELTINFINRANYKHNKKYDYSQTIYKNANTPIIIICKKHGQFLQRPCVHMRGSGCGKCAIDNRSLNIDKFITRSKKVHGNMYDYSLSIFTDSKTKIIIICPIHGRFQQLPHSHMKGYGCKKCSLIKIHDNNKLTNDIFIQKAIDKHGNKYDYSKTKYTKSYEKVEIICSKHGIFKQTANNHLNGCGCLKCGINDATTKRCKMTFELFIIQSNIIHNDAYIYELVEFVNNNTKVDIICPNHGVFKQSPNSHIRGYKCPSCSLNRPSIEINIDHILNNPTKLTYIDKQMTSSDFIRNSIKKHGNKYDYTKVKYVDWKTNVIIICPLHGEFEQTPDKHYKQYGCKQCSRIINAKNRTITFDNFIKKSNKIHNNKYLYDLVKYSNVSTKVDIICPDHGIFQQTPYRHMNNAKCPHCSFNRPKINININSLLNGEKINYITYKLTFETFIARANEIHNSIYDYSKVHFIDAYTNVIIICKKHGEFLKTPDQHLHKQICPACRKRKIIDFPLFLKLSNKIHNNKYNYTESTYVNTFTKITIICPIHGKFKQYPFNHYYYKRGCKKCGFDTLRKTIDEFINDAIKIHGDKYDYTNIDYKNNHTKVSVICPTHGEYLISHNTHCIKKVGCKKCSKHMKSSKKANKWLSNIQNKSNISLQTILSIGGEKYIDGFWMDGYDEITNTVYEFHGDFWHGNPKNIFI